MASITVSEARTYARIAHTGDDAAIAVAIDAAETELEMRTGWCVNAGTRTQYVASKPADWLLKLERQPASAAAIGSTALELVTIGGLVHAKIPDTTVFPVTVTVTVSASPNTLLKLALLQRVTETVQRRGDDTSAPSSAYWDNICTMLGKAVG